MKKAATFFSILVILLAGIYCASNMRQLAPTYNGKGDDMLALYENNSDYDLSNPDGAAEVIIKTNLDKTHSDNVVASVVFNYRGYDTMGESFVLFTAVVGSLVILRMRKTGKED